MREVLDRPWFVGQHWFQYIDQPPEGRSLDGENSNCGWLNERDEPYLLLTERSAMIYEEIYDRLPCR